MAEFKDFDVFRKRWKLASEAQTAQRQLWLDDLSFEAGEHWSAADLAARKLAHKPAITIDLLSGPIKQVTNQQRTARPGIQISAVGGAGDVETARVWQGIVRRVERLSHAGRVYTWAGQFQVKMGWGCWVVRNQVIGSSGEQDIRIEEVDNPFTVYVDPTTKKLDGSDKRWAIRFEDLTHDDYIERFGESKLSQALGQGWQSIGDAPPDWITGSHARIAEYYYLDKDGKVQWCLLNGSGEHLVEPVRIPGRLIPVVTIFGERRNIDGRVDCRGMVRMAKEPSRQEDWAESSLMETITLAKTAPWIAEWGQISEFKAIWETSNLTNYAVLPYKNVSGANGAPLPPPQRIPAGVDVTALTLAAQRMQQHVRQVMGQSDVLQEEVRREQSGRAITARKQIQELGTSDYLENLGDGIVLTARIIMSMGAEIYDTPRIMRIVGDDEREQAIVTHLGPDQRGAAEQLMASKQIDTLVDLSGDPEDYDVAISAGRNYQTARQEAVEMIGTAITAYPPIAPVALPILFRNSDFEGAQEIAAKLEPQKEGKPDPQVLQQQNQQLSQQLQQAMEYIKTEQAKQQAQVEKTRLDNEAELARAEMDNATKLELERIRSTTSLQLEAMKAEAAQIAQEAALGHAAVSQQVDQAHADLEAEAARAHAAQMGERGHMQALEQGEQAAALQPQPEGVV